MASVIHQLCQARALLARNYYVAMAAYRASGRLSEADRTVLRGMTVPEREAELASLYRQAAVSKVALADYDIYPIRPARIS